MVPHMEISCCIDQDFSRVGLPAPRPLYEVGHLGSPSPAMWAAVLPVPTGPVEPASQAHSRARSRSVRARASLVSDSAETLVSGRSRQSGSRVSPDRALGPDGVAR